MTMTHPYFDVVIRRAADNVERVYRMKSTWVVRTPDDEEDRNLFWWEDSNGACDCNRGDFFARAGGEPDQEGDACGESRYLVMRFILPDGTTIDGPDARAD